MNLNEMKVRTRLALGFALVLVLLAIVTVLGLVRMAQIQDRLDRVVSVNSVVSRLVSEMRDNVSDRETRLRILTLLSDPADMEPEMVKIKAQTDKYGVAMKALSDKFAAVGSPEEKALLAQIREYEAQTMPAIAKASELYLAANAEEATRVMIREVRPPQRKWLAALQQLATMEEKLNAQVQAEAE
ncbi:MAG TPA: MCP four helix bundle domain-containing protein, partial [Telluria sp.]